MTVYFLQVGEDGPVKIGHSTQKSIRIGALKNSNPSDLRVIREIDGGAVVEGWLHRRFSDYRLRGEWFDFTPEMLSVEVPPRVRAAQTLEADGDVKMDAPTLLAELRELVMDLVGFAPGEGRADKIENAAQLLGMRTARVRRWFYGDCREVGSAEAEQIRVRVAYVKKKLGRRRARYETKRSVVFASLSTKRLDEDRSEYEAERQGFIAAAPRALAWLAPPSLPAVEVQEAPVKRRRK